ncbi:MAG: vitamin K epoxide reductase family protein [Terriglobales bacterium]
MKALHLLIVLCCLFGITAATLAYGEHYNTSPSPCQINAVWDCGIVNHSHYAVVGGVPVALIGVLGYAVLIAVVGRFPWLAFGGALAGFLFSLRYSYLEWKVLQTWCLYCALSQIAIALVTLLTLLAALRARHPAGPRAPG